MPTLDAFEMDGCTVEFRSDGTGTIEMDAMFTRTDLLDAVAYALYGIDLRATAFDGGECSEIIELLDAVIDSLSHEQACDVLSYIARVNDIDITVRDE